MKSPIVKRSIVIAGHKTSVSLEDDFWNLLKEIAEERGTSLSELIASIKADRPTGTLSTPLRLFALKHLQDQLPALLGRGQSGAAACHGKSANSRSLANWIDAARPAQTPPSQT